MYRGLGFKRPRNLWVLCVSAIFTVVVSLNLSCSSEAPEAVTAPAVEETMVTVPDLMGQTLQNALNMISAADLKFGQLERKTDAAARDTVLSQSPAAGLQMPPGSNVNIVIADKPDDVSITIPNLSGFSEDEAVSVAVGLGLQIAEDQLQRWKEKRQSTRGMAGGEDSPEVVNQEPPPGSVVDRGSTVRLVVDEEGQTP